MHERMLSTSITKPAEDITLRDMLMPLFRRKRLVIATFMLIAVASGLAALAVSHSYESKMEVLVNRERSDPLVSTESTAQMIAPTPAVTEEEINSEAELLRSQDVLEKVVVANGLQEKERRTFWRRLYPRRGEREYVSSAARHLGNSLKIDTLPKTNLIRVSYASADPQVSYGVLNTLATLYLEKHVAVHRPTGAYDFFAKEADKYQQALADSEARLASFDREKGAVAPDTERTNMALVMANAVASLHQAEQVVASDEQRMRTDLTQMKSTPKTSVSQEVSNSADVLLQQLNSSLLTAEIKRTQLLLKFEPTYPLVREVDQEIAQTQAAIARAQDSKYINRTQDRDPTFELLREDAAKTQSDLDAQRANVSASKQSIRSIQSEMVSLDQKALNQADLLREIKANEDNYLLYLSKREQERTSDALDKKRIANVAIAVPPGIPSLPVTSPVLVLLGGLAGAIVLSAGMGYTVEYFDSSFRTPSEVIDLLGVPVVIAIPKQTGAGANGIRLLRA